MIIFSMEHELTFLILKNLNKNWTDIAKLKHGKSPEITYGDLIFSIISHRTIKESREALGIKEQTFNRALKKCFPEITLIGGGQTWSYYLLHSIGYKRCFKCNSIKALELCLTDGCCKECRHQYNVTELRRDLNKKSQRVYYYNNIKYFRQKNAKYRAAHINACPAWANLEEIKQFYYNCPVGYHVDHIIPLQGKYVCGLHILNNLQYLTASENCSKSNYHESEEYWK